MLLVWCFFSNLIATGNLHGFEQVENPTQAFLGELSDVEAKQLSSPFGLHITVRFVHQPYTELLAAATLQLVRHWGHSCGD